MATHIFRCCTRSYVVSKKTTEDELVSFFNCSGLYIFSRDEVLKATNYFDDLNLIGETKLGMNYDRYYDANHD